MKNRNRTIDIIKGIAILLVLITHFEWSERAREFFCFPYIIKMAVPIFMIVTGYVYSLSFTKQKITHMEEAYNFKILLRRIGRYTLPIIALAVWEIADPHMKLQMNLPYLVKWIINGTYGKGNYYYPVMMQMIFLFPIIYFIFDRFKEKGLLICFLLNMLLELLAWAYDMNTEFYRLSAFRYIFVTAAGAFAFHNYKIKAFSSILITAAGGLFIAFITYFDYTPRIVNADWASTNCMSSMLIVPLLIWVLQNVKLHFTPLEMIGRASYHIFLVQMAYYRGYYYILQSKIGVGYIHLMAGIMVCLLAGLLFYYIDKPVQTWWDKMVLKHIA